MSIPLQMQAAPSQRIGPDTRSPIPGFTIPDPNNTIIRHSERQLSLSEGIYKLRDEITLGNVPPHPSEPASQVHHVLDPKLGPPTAGARLSAVVIAPRKTSLRLRRVPTTASTKSASIPPSIQEAPIESTSGSGSETGSLHPRTTSKVASGNFKALFGGGNSNAAPSSETPSKDSRDTGKDGVKRKKPKNSLSKSGTSFVSRHIPHENFSKRLQERNNEGLMVFLNHTRMFMWLDMAAHNKHEPLSKILFTKAHALSHDVNQETRSSSHLDLALGFNSADILWLEAVSQKYTRLNKNGALNKTPITAIRWLPGSDTLFATGHTDGTIMILDKDKDDATFTPDVATANGASASKHTLLVKRSIKSKPLKTNPVAFWKVSKEQVNQMVFSPNGQTLAVVTEDGALRLIDHAEERLLKVFPSYYGGVSCVAWSPDGLYLVTGGQDDMLSIWSVEDATLVARCDGHRSWVTHVAFDAWRCDDRAYRFASVGEDCRLLLWDFAVGMLPRARAASVRQPSISSHTPAHPSRSHSQTSLTPITSSSAPASGSSPGFGAAVSKPRLSPELARQATAEDEDGDGIYEKVVPRALRPMLRPVMSTVIDPHILTWVGFDEDCLITVCAKGHVQTWDRPRGESAGNDDAVGPSDPFLS